MPDFFLVNTEECWTKYEGQSCYGWAYASSEARSANTLEACTADCQADDCFGVVFGGPYGCFVCKGKDPRIEDVFQPNATSDTYLRYCSSGIFNLFWDLKIHV